MVSTTTARKAGLRRPSLNRDAAIALALAATLFGCFGALSVHVFGPGYEPTYAASAEGFVRTAVPQLVRDTPNYRAALGGSPEPAPGPVYPGPTVGWSGPVTAVPLVAPAMALDWLRHRVTGNDSGSFRKAAATLYARVLILLTAVVLYLLAVSFYGRRRLAAGIALAFGLTTLALPYTRIGMEPPLVFWTTAAFAAAYRARRVNSAGSWLLAGICAGFAGATRNPAAWVLVAPIMAYGALGLLRPRRQSSTRLLAFAVPILLAAIAAAAYNVARCDEVVCGLGQQTLGHAANGGLATDKARLGFVEGLYGLLLSPGKSFFITSPIVVVGAIGLWRARDRLRAEVLTVLASGLVALAVLSPLSYWSEETYGPRYVLFLVPLVLVFAGFATNVSRRIVVLLLVLGAILQVSVLIPVGAHSPCATYVKPLVGDARFDQNTCRFVPELSDGILDVRLTFAVLRNMVGLGVTNLTYEPYVGAPGGVIERRQIRITQDRPFLFWAQRSSAANLILLLAYVLTAAGGAIALRRLLVAQRPVSRG